MAVAKDAKSAFRLRFRSRLSYFLGKTSALMQKPCKKQKGWSGTGAEAASERYVEDMMNNLQFLTWQKLQIVFLICPQPAGSDTVQRKPFCFFSNV